MSLDSLPGLYPWADDSHLDPVHRLQHNHHREDWFPPSTLDPGLQPEIGSGDIGSL